MASIVLEESSPEKLFPFTETRHIADIRLGILTIREKWQRLSGSSVQTMEEDKEGLKIPANLIPDSYIVKSIQEGSQITRESFPEAKWVEYPWQIFEFNDYCLRSDFEFLTSRKISQAIPESVQVTRSTNVFIEEGAHLSHCILNAGSGPIYIGRNAEIMEGAMIRGPVAICEGAVVKMGAKIYGSTTIGPFCVVGGEIKNSVIFGFSNKAHDGYLGDSVIGEWCNLGAGTSNSNLKNTGGIVKVWNESVNGYVEAGQKCGLLMGDYSRASINTSFNTGTVVGVSCNYFASGLSPKFIPSFRWGIEETYEFEKAINDIRNWKKMKNHNLSDSEIQQLKLIFDQVKKK